MSEMRRTNVMLTHIVTAQRVESASVLGGGIRAYLGKEYLTSDDLSRLTTTSLAMQYDVVGDTSPTAVANSQWHLGANVPTIVGYLWRSRWPRRDRLGDCRSRRWRYGNGMGMACNDGLGRAAA